MNGPCMCGDICCPSCGPAQGNSRCPICHEWVSECCDHVDPDTGDIRPAFAAQVEEIYRKQREADIAYAQQEMEWSRCEP